MLWYLYIQIGQMKQADLVVSSIDWCVATLFCGVDKPSVSLSVVFSSFLKENTRKETIFLVNKRT